MSAENVWHKTRRIALRHLLLFGSGGLLCCACTERMDITSDYITPRLVITGCITTDTAAHKIQVRRTAAYFGKEQQLTYPDAIVKINNVPLLPAGNGDYLTEPSFAGISGQTYTLDVWLDFDEDGADEHYSATAVMTDMHVLDSITLATVSPGAARPPWMLIVHFQDLPGPNNFGVHLHIHQASGRQIWYSEQLRRYFINNFGDHAAEGQYIRFPALSYIIDENMRWYDDERIALQPGDTLIAELNALAPDYFEFIRAAQQEIGGGNPLFAGPPANVPTNIHGGALGFFGACTASRQRLIIPQW
ncbi:MAG: DUF4249 domain-containing protein [Prevotellaceae bacterium]|jgi:hypothetical protein|nr:DUF4249 domain-containing protein [Prevotellaceae bacterium]